MKEICLLVFITYLYIKFLTFRLLTFYMICMKVLSTTSKLLFEYINVKTMQKFLRIQKIGKLPPIFKCFFHDLFSQKLRCIVKRSTTPKNKKTRRQRRNWIVRRKVTTFCRTSNHRLQSLQVESALSKIKGIISVDSFKSLDH